MLWGALGPERYARAIRPLVYLLALALVVGVAAWWAL